MLKSPQHPQVFYYLFNSPFFCCSLRPLLLNLSVSSQQANLKVFSLFVSYEYCWHKKNNPTNFLHTLNLGLHYVLGLPPSEPYFRAFFSRITAFLISSWCTVRVSLSFDSVVQNFFPLPVKLLFSLSLPGGIWSLSPQS